MEFIEIDEDSKVYPGEYLLHIPTKRIVICGAFVKSENLIKALKEGKLITEKISNFKKIKMSNKEKRERKTKSCGGCKKR